MKTFQLLSISPHFKQVLRQRAVGRFVNYFDIIKNNPEREPKLCGISIQKAVN